MFIDMICLKSQSEHNDIVVKNCLMVTIVYGLPLFVIMWINVFLVLELFLHCNKPWLYDMLLSVDCFWLQGIKKQKIIYIAKCLSDP